MKTVFVTDGGWGPDIAASLEKYLGAQPGLTVINDRQYYDLSREGTLPPIDVCVCTSTNATSGQGEDTDARLEAEVISKGIPLLQIDTDVSLRSGVGPKAALTFDFHAVRAEMRQAAETTPASFARILMFVNEQKEPRS